jgi:hypothetical protein
MNILYDKVYLRRIINFGHAQGLTAHVKQLVGTRDWETKAPPEKCNTDLVFATEISKSFVV